MRKDLKESVPTAKIHKILKYSLGYSSGVARISYVRGGLFNTSYKIELSGQRRIFLRIAPPQDRALLGYEKGLLQREVYPLTKLQGHDFPVPKLLFKDFSRTIIDRDYIISEYCIGHNAYYKMKDLSQRQQELLFAELGTYAKKIHAIDNKEGWFGCPAPFKRYQRWSEFIGFYAGSLQADLQAHPYLSLPTGISLSLIVDNLRDILDEITVPKLIHGDLWWRNILIAKEEGDYKISAILDWDRILWGDPYFEWILYGLDLTPAFWEKYCASAPTGRSHQVRQLLYKACGCVQAALEDSIHFHLRKNSLEMMGYAMNNITELLKAQKLQD